MNYKEMLWDICVDYPLPTVGELGKQFPELAEKLHNAYIAIIKETMDSFTPETFAKALEQVTGEIIKKND